MKPVRIIPDSKYPNMYRLQWKDGSISVKYYDPDDPMDDGGPNSYGMYNLTRANDILKNYSEYKRWETLAKNTRLLRARKVTDAFK